MTTPRSIAARSAFAALFIGAAFALAGCSSSPVIAPVTVEVGDLQGDTVTLQIGQVLNIDTGDLGVGSFEAEIADPSIAKFAQGGEGGDATYNPGITALAEGSTEVVLTNDNGGIEPLTFTIDVTG